MILTVGAGTAQASLIAMNDVVYGPNSVIFDNVNNKQWLILAPTVGLSVNAINSGAGGFLAQGFHVSSTAELAAMYASGGWDGLDDSATAGPAAHRAFVQQLHTLFGVTGAEGNGDPFNEGWSIPVGAPANITSRPFNTLVGGSLGRVACTQAGYTAFPETGLPPHNNFGRCGFSTDQSFSFIGAWLVRDPQAPAVPEPSSFALLGIGGAVAAFRLRRRSRG